MRWFLVWLIFCWLLGIVGGVVGLETSAVLLVGLAVTYWGWRYALSVSVLVAGIALVLLGYLHGGLAEWQLEETDCVQLERNFEALITSVLRQESSRTQYVVRREDGCTLLVTVSAWPRFGVGDRVEVAGKMELVEALPQELAGYGQYLQRQGIGATVMYPQVELVTGGGSVWWRSRTWLSGRVNRVLQEPEASVIRAMMWGERGAVEEEIEEQLTAAGVRHVLAISGLHVSLVVGGLAMLIRLGRWPRPVELGVLLLLLWGYVWLVGSPVSAVRAGWFWSVFLVGWRGRVLVSWLTALVVTLLVLMSWQPLVVLDAGLQLSLAAVAGIALSLKILEVERGGSAGWAVRGLVGATGAMLATAPITMSVFGEASMAGLVTNVLVLPVLPLLLGAAAVAVISGIGWEPLGVIVGLSVRGVWWYVDRVTAVAAQVPGLHVQEMQVPGWWLVWWYPLLGMGMLTWLQKRGGNWRMLWE